MVKCFKRHNTSVLDNFAGWNYASVTNCGSLMSVQDCFSLPVSAIRTHTNIPPAHLALYPMVQSAPTTHESPVTDVIVAMHKHTNPHCTIPCDQGFLTATDGKIANRAMVLLHFRLEIIIKVKKSLYLSYSKLEISLLRKYIIKTDICMQFKLNLIKPG